MGNGEMDDMYKCTPYVLLCDNLTGFVLLGSSVVVGGGGGMIISPFSVLWMVLIKGNFSP